MEKIGISLLNLLNNMKVGFRLVSRCGIPQRLIIAKCRLLHSPYPAGKI